MSADPTAPITMTMVQTKQTKGTVVFTEEMTGEQSEARPHTFYILKDTFGELGEPEAISVTIDPA